MTKIRRETETERVCVRAVTAERGVGCERRAGRGAGGGWREAAAAAAGGDEEKPRDEENRSARTRERRVGRARE